MDWITNKLLHKAKQPKSAAAIVKPPATTPKVEAKTAGVEEEKVAKQ